MGLDHETAAKIGCGFGGGMHVGSVCGAVTGAIMAIGLKHGGVGMQPSARTGKLIVEFVNRFKAIHCSIGCTDLIGVNLAEIDPWNHPERFAELMEKNTFAPCPDLVRDAATIAEELVTRPGA